MYGDKKYLFQIKKWFWFAVESLEVGLSPSSSFFSRYSMWYTQQLKLAALWSYLFRADKRIHELYVYFYDIYHLYILVQHIDYNHHNEIQ